MLQKWTASYQPPASPPSSCKSIHVKRFVLALSNMSMLLAKAIHQTPSPQAPWPPQAPSPQAPWPWRVHLLLLLLASFSQLPNLRRAPTCNWVCMQCILFRVFCSGILEELIFHESRPAAWSRFCLCSCFCACGPAWSCCRRRQSQSQRS